MPFPYSVKFGIIAEIFIPRPLRTIAEYVMDAPVSITFWFLYIVIWFSIHIRARNIFALRAPHIFFMYFIQMFQICKNSSASSNILDLR